MTNIDFLLNHTDFDVTSVETLKNKNVKVSGVFYHENQSSSFHQYVFTPQGTYLSDEVTDN